MSLEPGQLYACPACHGALLDEPAGAALTGGDGALVCAAGHRFALRRGMPCFVADEGYASSFGLQWKRHATEQVDSRSGATITRDRFFRGTGWPERMPGERILEAGCGSGRFTEVLLSTGASVVSFDYSEAAEVTHRNFGPAGAAVCQASIYEMPYRAASFDRVFCYGVIQHCPDVRAAFLELVKMVKPGGHLAVDVYDRRRMWLNARYRVRWLTRRLDKEKLHRLCERVVPLYLRFAPPLHPWNQLLVPIKDYRGVLPGLGREQEIAWSVLDTFDMLSPAFDQPQYRGTMERWCREAGLVEISARHGGNGVEVNARRPA
jgi:SAM-dependent methyltransferase